MQAGSHSGVDNGRGLVIWKPDVSCFGFGVVRNYSEIIVGNREICSGFRNVSIGVSEGISIVTMWLACEKSVNISRRMQLEVCNFWSPQKVVQYGGWVVGTTGDEAEEPVRKRLSERFRHAENGTGDV
jgi:hypothetical protein